MKRDRTLASIAIVAAALGSLGISQPAVAQPIDPYPTLNVSNDTETDGPTGFGFFASGGFDAYYDALTSAVSPSTAAKVLGEPSTEVRDILELQGVSTSQQAAILQEASKAASEGAGLPRSVAERLDSASEAEVGTFNLGAPILGGPINNDRSWRFQDTYYWAECPNSCHVEGHAQFTYTIDPGEYNTRLTVSTLEIGDAVQEYSVEVQPYYDAQWGGIYDSEPWGTNSTETLYMGPHSPTRGYSMIYYVRTSVWGGSVADGGSGIGVDYHFRTNSTAPCEEPAPGAYQCRFL